MAHIHMVNIITIIIVQWILIRRLKVETCESEIFVQIESADTIRIKSRSKSTDSRLQFQC